MDLSWSYNQKADAPALVQNLQAELRKHIRNVSGGVNKLENVTFAINEGGKTLRGILCKQCKYAVTCKSKELYSQNELPHRKKKLKMLSPECQQLVDELSNKLFQLERSQNVNKDDEEYCTQQQYHTQQMLEMEDTYKKELQDMYAEKTEIESKCKNELQEKGKIIHELQEQIESEKRGQRTELNRLKTNLEIAERKNVQLKKDLARKEEETRRKGSSSWVYGTSRDTPDNEIKRLKENLRSKENALQTSQKENESMLSRIKELSQNLENLTELLDNQKKENGSLNESLSVKDVELKLVKSQLKELEKAKKKDIVMGLCKERSGMGKTMVDMITRELKRRVGGQLDRDNINLTIQTCKTTSDIPNGPLVVLCLNMSRIGTNIQDAMEGINADKHNVFVLVLHHTSKENLSSLTPTSLRVTGSELRQLGGIIDMAFSSDGGLYECDLNNNAVEKITSIMRKYMIL